MVCPDCHAVAPDGALQCGSCGSGFGEAGQTRTFAAFAPGGGSGLLFAPGSDFGPRYRIETLLGEGGMGRVYKAYDKDLNRTVAIKLVRSEFATDPHSIARFKQELLLASRISHKNILRIHDLGDVDGAKFISMTYVEGEDLHDLMQREGKLSAARAIAMARQLCGALDAAHAENVVHRDLKPRNILVDKAGNLYISDFGLARSLGDEATRMTQTGMLVGTPRYMSPEQVEGQPADHRSDLYSLGIILYEMVTGDMPFRANSTLEIMYQRVHGIPKDPREVCPEVPAELACVIMRCLQKDVSLRYQSAREILNDLDTGQVTKTIAIATKRSRFPRRPIVFATVGMALLAAGLLVSPSVRRYVATRESSQRKAAMAGKYIAVLPLRPLGDTDALKYQAEGIGDALSAKLFHMKDLHLASPSAVQRANLNAPLDKVARSLGVNLLVYGTLQASPDGKRLVSIVKLEDVAANRLLWTEEFSESSQELLPLEDRIFNKLVGALEYKLNNEEMAGGLAHPTENTAAYDVYLRGRSLMRGQRDEKNISTAMNLYNEAIQKDPGFAEAYAAVADASMYMFDIKKDGMWLEKALGAANQATRINPNLPEAHIALGSAYRVSGKSNEAISEFKQALRLAPNSDEAYRRLASTYARADKRDEAIEAYRKAIAVNPYFWENYNQLGAAYIRMGETDLALENFRKVTSMEPELPVGHMNIGMAYYKKGDFEHSIPEFQKAVNLKATSLGYANLSAAYVLLGKYEEAVTAAEKAVALNPSNDTAAGNLADAYRFSGRKEKARHTYDTAISLAFKTLQANTRDSACIGRLALYYSKEGDRVRAAEFIRRALAMKPNDPELLFEEAIVTALAGHETDALTSLRKALEAGYTRQEMERDPELAKVRALPDYRKIMDSAAPTAPNSDKR